MRFSSTPLSFNTTDSRITIVRNIEERISMLDNLVELIVFTPKGSFDGDPDFGFEYWNHEYSNILYRQFNNDQSGMVHNGMSNEITKKECEESIRESLATYAPQLKQVLVTMELKSVEEEMLQKSKNIENRMSNNKKQLSKYIVFVVVDGVIDDGLGTTCPYNKEVKFLMEPTAKNYNI